MADYKDGSTVRGIRLKTGRIVYELRDKKGQPVLRGEFNAIRDETRAAHVYPEYLVLIEEEK
jgi:hypothetical protein